MQYVTIPPYICRKSYLERDVLPPSNKVLIRIYYEPNIRIIPKWIRKKASNRASLTMEPYEIPMLIKMKHSEFNDFIRYKAQLSDWYRITKVKLRHTIGGIHSRFEIAFTNHKNFKYPTLRTESTIRLIDKLPESIKKETKHYIYSDMCGVTFEYSFENGNLKIVNYLKLMNYFGDYDLKNKSIFIIPSDYVDGYDF